MTTTPKDPPPEELPRLDAIDASERRWAVLMLEARDDRDRALSALRNCVAALNNGSFILPIASVTFHCQAYSEVAAFVAQASEQKLQLERAVAALRTVVQDDENCDLPELIRRVELDLNCEHERALIAERGAKVAEKHLAGLDTMRQQERLVGFQHGWDQGVNAWAISNGKLVRMLLDMLKASENCEECVGPSAGICEVHEPTFKEVCGLLENRLSQLKLS